MAEDLPRAGGDRRLLIITLVVVIIIFGFFLLSLRSCSVFSRDKGYTVIYSNLDLKDSANVIVRLKELKIPYEIRDKGTAVAVPKEKADEARLGLAEKNLPMGGVVGWEIFDESKLGATDFDRRVQLIRAISGELSRTIRRIEVIEDCRVQIVLPETKLFEATQAPVTASVLLKLKSGMHLTPSQVNGIVHLVASSVENLQPQNVTIIDERGKILSNIVQEKMVEAVRAEMQITPTIAPVATQGIITKEVIVIKTVEAQPKPITAEERALLKVKAKEELEKQLTVSTQYLLDKFYPPNTVIVRVAVELKDDIDGAEPAATPSTLEPKEINLGIKRVYTIVLVDEKFSLPASLKKSTYATIIDTVGYNAKRGDRIVLRKVPFYYATGKAPEITPASAIKTPSAMPVKGKAQTYEAAAVKGNRLSYITANLSVLFGKGISFLKKMGLRNVLYAAGGFIVFLFIIVIFRRITRKKAPAQNIEGAEPALDAGATLNAIKSTADKSPEKIANLLKSWLTEE